MTWSTVSWPEPLAEVADAAEEPEHQRRQREQHEEARLGGQTGHAVAQADPDRLHREPRDGHGAGDAQRARGAPAP